MAHWLLKSSPKGFSIDDLKAAGTEPWDGVRNYEARNNIQSMKKGDTGFFYHSSANPSGIIGTLKIASDPKPDPTQFDPDARHYDPDSDADDPTWFLVDVSFDEKWQQVLPLSRLKELETLENSPLINHGRLTIMPIEEDEVEAIMHTARQEGCLPD